MRNTVNNSTEFNELYIKILKLVQEQKHADRKLIHDIAFNYFKKKFPQFEIHIEPKYEGIQLGCKV